MAKTTVVLLNRIKIGKILNKLQQPPFLQDSERGGDEEGKLVKKCLKITTVQVCRKYVYNNTARHGLELTFLFRHLPTGLLPTVQSLLPFHTVFLNVYQAVIITTGNSHTAQ